MAHGSTPGGRAWVLMAPAAWVSVIVLVVLGAHAQEDAGAPPAALDEVLPGGTQMPPPTEATNADVPPAQPSAIGTEMPPPTEEVAVAPAPPAPPPPVKQEGTEIPPPTEEIAVAPAPPAPPPPVKQEAVAVPPQLPVAVSLVPPTEKGRLPRRLPQKRGPSEAELKARHVNAAKMQMKKAMEGLDAAEMPLIRRLEEVHDALKPEELPQLEREQAVQAVTKHLHAEFRQHCHLDEKRPLRDFARGLELAHSHHVAMDEGHMAQVMQTFNARIRAQMEETIESRSVDQLNEMWDVVGHTNFKRYWPKGDEGARQVEEWSAWSEEVFHALERESARQDALKRLDEAPSKVGIGSHQEALRHAEEVCDMEDLVHRRSVLQQREAELADFVRQLDEATEVIRGTDRRPTEPEYYALLDLFNAATKRNMQTDNMTAWDEARRALREALTRLGEG